MVANEDKSRPWHYVALGERLVRTRATREVLRLCVRLRCSYCRGRLLASRAAYDRARAAAAACGRPFVVTCDACLPAPAGDRVVVAATDPEIQSAIDAGGLSGNGA